MKKLYIVYLIVILLLISSCKNERDNEVSSQISYSTLEITESVNEDYFNDISLIKGVIQNKEKYVCTENNESIYLKEFHSKNYLIINDKGEYEYTKDNNETNHIFNRFCVIDIDDDGKSELLLESESSNIILFHCENDVVYGYSFPFRGMLNVKLDGSFGASGSAGTYLIGKIKFVNNECVYHELCCFNEMDGYDNTYRVNGEIVEKKVADEYIKRQDKKENAKWYKYNLKLMPYDIEEE